MMSATGLYFLLLLWRRTSAQGAELRCSEAGPAAGDPHPVRGLLETFGAGPGCAARERGDKETHAVAVRRSTDSGGSRVTVLLKPLSLTPSPVRALHLLLSSQRPVSWWLEAEQLPAALPVHVQVSSNSSVQSHALHVLVHAVPSLPFRPRALHRWALRHHGSVSSLTHAAHANRVYIRLGDDPTLPPVCHLQATFLLRHYLTSDLQPQRVQGCSRPPAAAAAVHGIHPAVHVIHPAVHVIKLHSAGSGLCGSVQVEVVVSLLPPLGDTRAQEVVLILSSSAAVNWAVAARGVWGHVSVHSSNSVSPPFPPEPDLTVSSTLNSDLSSVSDLLAWANGRGYSEVTSYTEAHLANRFVIQLAGGGTDILAVRTPLAASPPRAEERRLREGLSGGGRAGGRESLTVQCDDGRLSVTVDRRALQTLSIPVATVTLQDPACQARSNGSHFLLAFPVISCGTEGLLVGRPRGVQYKNTMLLWRDRPGTVVSLNETERKLRGPLGVHFSCLAAVPSVSGEDTPRPRPVHRGPGDPAGPGPALSRLRAPGRRAGGPVLTLRLFVTEDYEEKRMSPCVVPAGHRVYVQISATGPRPEALEVRSCVVSPLSDPKRSPFWTVISGGCSSDPSLTLGGDAPEDEDGDEGGAREMKNSGTNQGDVSARHRPGRRRTEAPEGTEGSSRNMEEEETEEVEEEEEEEEETQLLRFSFILRPIHNASLQFLHCSLQMCSSDPPRGGGVTEPAACRGGGLRIPAVESESPKHQCETRNLSRPMVVTQPISSLAPSLLSPPTAAAGPRTTRRSVATPAPQHASVGLALQTAPLMGLVFAAFLMGVGLVGGLWCIHNCTAAGPTPRGGGGEGQFTDRPDGGHGAWNPPLLSDQSSV